MLNVLPFSPDVPRFWSPFRSEYRLQGLFWRFWRVCWLILGVWFAWGWITAELRMAALFDGREHALGEVYRLADGAVVRFPFDHDLRNWRAYVLAQVARDASPSGTR